MTIPMFKLAAIGIAATITAASASAGEWVLNENRCPDLVEDRIDARVTHNRRDAIEDRKDMRVIECPRSAWTYEPSRGERVQARRSYTGPTVIYAGRDGSYKKPVITHAKANQKRTSRTPALINVIIR